MSGRADVVHGFGSGLERSSGIGPASKGSTVTAPWPLNDTLTLGALPTAVASARAHARQVASEWAMANMADTIALVVSELVTNAVAASSDGNGQPRYSARGLPVVHLRLLSDQTRIVVAVWDEGTGVPMQKSPETDAEEGRGLQLIDALCVRWQWEIVPGWPGKVVWAELVVE